MHYLNYILQIAVDQYHCFVSHLSKNNISLTLSDTAGQERFDSICTVSDYISFGYIITRQIVFCFIIIGMLVIGFRKAL